MTHKEIAEELRSMVPKIDVTTVAYMLCNAGSQFVNGLVDPVDVLALADKLDPPVSAIDALQALYDVQNGPPLERYTDEWNAAMKMAEDALNKAEVK